MQFSGMDYPVASGENGTSYLLESLKLTIRCIRILVNHGILRTESCFLDESSSCLDAGAPCRLGLS